MQQNIIHIGLDVDDIQSHGAAFNKETGEVIDFKSRPTLKGLLQQTDRMARHFTVLFPIPIIGADPVAETLTHDG